MYIQLWMKLQNNFSIVYFSAINHIIHIIIHSSYNITFLKEILMLLLDHLVEVNHFYFFDYVAL